MIRFEQAYLSLEKIPPELLNILGTTHSQRIATLVIDTIYHTRQLLEVGAEVLVEPGPEAERALWGLREFMFENIYRGRSARLNEAGPCLLSSICLSITEIPGENEPTLSADCRRRWVGARCSRLYFWNERCYCVSLFKDIYIPQSLVPDTGRVLAGRVSFKLDPKL